MPQATDEHRARCGGSDGIGPEKAIAFLEEHGFILSKGWHWKVPRGHKTTDEEHDAMMFLVCEWDFGGFDHER